MLTADTITDDQIRELRDEARRARAYGLRDICEQGLGEPDVDVIAHAALYPARRPTAKQAVRRARARCAEILNARRSR